MKTLTNFLRLTAVVAGLALLNPCVVEAQFCDGIDLPSKALNFWTGDFNAADEVTDVVRNSNGTHFGNVISSPGKVGNALEFPNYTGPAGYVKVPHDDAWLWGTRDFTIEFWVKFDQFTPVGLDYWADAFFIGLDNGAGSNNKWFFAIHSHELDPNNPGTKVSELSFHINDDCSGDGKWLVDAPFTPALDTWYHLAVVRNGNLFTIYINGLVAGTPETYDYAVPNPTGDLFIGGGADETLSRLFGFLDEITMYGRALCASEIQAIYNADFVGKCPPSQPNSLPSPPNLVAWWSAEGNTSDMVYGQEGIIIGGVTYDCLGYAGRAFSFNGTSGYVKVPNSSHLNGTGSFTVEAWVRFSQLTGGAGICVVAKGIDAEAQIDWALNISSNGKLRPQVKLGGIWRSFDCTTTLNANTWYHVAMVYNGATIKGYVNGQENGFMNASGAVASSTHPLRIGAYAPASATLKSFFPGKIDEVSLYSGALEANDILGVYNARAAGKRMPPPVLTRATTPGKVAWWPADCSSTDGTYLRDVAGINHLQRPSSPNNGTTTNAGFVGNSFAFHGQDYLQNSTIANPGNNSPLTVECWLKREAVVGPYDPVIKKAGGGGGQNGGYSLEFNGNGIVFYIYNNGAWRQTAIFPLELGKWYHVAGVYASPNLSLYVNGVLVGNLQPVTGSILASSNPLRIGNDAANPTRFFKGRVDEAAIYHSILSPDDIKTIYNASYKGKQ